MLQLLRTFFVALIGCARSRRELVSENLALRQQLAALAARQPRPRLTAHDRLFWVILRRFWSDWSRVLVIVHPETVVGWHRAGFKLYWKWISRRPMQSGRKPTPKALRELNFRIVMENSTWGAPRMHGELIVMVWAFRARFDRALELLSLPSQMLQDLRANETKLAGLEAPASLDPNTKAALTNMIRQAFVFGFRIIMLVCAGLSVASAVVAWMMLPKAR